MAGSLAYRIGRLTEGVSRPLPSPKPPKGKPSGHIPHYKKFKVFSLFCTPCGLFESLVSSVEASRFANKQSGYYLNAPHHCLLVYVTGFSPQSKFKNCLGDVPITYRNPKTRLCAPC